MSATLVPVESIRVAGVPETPIERDHLATQLARFIDPSRILTRSIDRIAFASDASLYRLIPRAVVQPLNSSEVRELFQFSRQQGIPLTFRAGGTSLCGQAITDGILVDIGRYWRSGSVEQNGAAIRVEPGLIGQRANQMLKTYAAKIGPDPASISAARMGGILANNASGMCCGVTQNAYHTLRSMTFLLPSGTLINTANPDAALHFREREPELAAGLLAIKRQLEADPALSSRIRSKYRMKNTTGYSLNAFLDYAEPVDIFSHLLIGSEGTLAFIAEAVLDTVPDLPVKYTGLLLFPNLHAACEAIAPLRAAGAAALELMDRASLRSVENKPGIPPQIRDLPKDAAALLVEFQTADANAVQEKRSQGASGRSQSAPARRALLHRRHHPPGSSLEHPQRSLSLRRRGPRGRNHGHHRRRSRSRRASRRRRHRPHPSLREASLSERHHLRPRQGRQSPLRSHPGFQHRQGSSPVPQLHGRRRPAGGEQI